MKNKEIIERIEKALKNKDKLPHIKLKPTMKAERSRRMKDLVGNIYYNIEADRLVLVTDYISIIPNLLAVYTVNVGDKDDIHLGQFGDSYIENEHNVFIGKL